MRTRKIDIEDAIYVEKSFSLHDALRLSKDAIYDLLDHSMLNDVEVLDFRAVPIDFSEDYVIYKIYPIEYISRFTTDDPVKIYVRGLK